MHFFLAGIMQADRRDKQIEPQDYRVRLTAVLESHVPNLQITDPWAANPNSISYDDNQARDTFLSMTRRAAEANVLIAYLPAISMGTAMEMWQAHLANVYIIAVTPFIHHWAIKFTADEIHPDLDSVVAAIENGRFAQWHK